MARSLLNFTRSVVNSIIRRAEPDEEFSDDFQSQTQQGSTNNSDVVSVVSYTTSEIGLPPLQREIRKLSRLRQLLGAIPEDDEDREEVQLAIELCQLRKSRLEKELQKQTFAQPLLLKFPSSACRQTLPESKPDMQTDQLASQLKAQHTQERNTRYSESEVQRRLQHLDENLRGKPPREPCPPQLGEILNIDEVEQLKAQGYNFKTVVVTDLNHVQWDAVVEVSNVPLAHEAKEQEKEVHNAESNPHLQVTGVQKGLRFVSTSPHDRQEIEPPRFQKGKSGIIESDEKQKKLLGVNKDLKTYHCEKSLRSEKSLRIVCANLNRFGTRSFHALDQKLLKGKLNTLRLL